MLEFKSNALSLPLSPFFPFNFCVQQAPPLLRPTRGGGVWLVPPPGMGPKIQKKPSYAAINSINGSSVYPAVPKIGAWACPASQPRNASLRQQLADAFRSVLGLHTHT